MDPQITRTDFHHPCRNHHTIRFLIPVTCLACTNQNQNETWPQNKTQNIGEELVERNKVNENKSFIAAWDLLRQPRKKDARASVAYEVHFSSHTLHWLLQMSLFVHLNRNFKTVRVYSIFKTSKVKNDSFINTW